MNIISVLEQEQLRSDIPAFRPGDTVKVHVKVVEGNRERIQIFEGRRHRPSERRCPRNLHRSPHFLWRRRRTYFPGTFPASG